MRTLLRLAVLAPALAAGTAHADLYRWIDPQSGSVKFSSVPPPWLGDAEREAVSPKVEVISSRPKPAATAPAAAAPGAADKAAAQAAVQAAAIAAERRREEELRLKAKPEAQAQ